MLLILFNAGNERFGIDVEHVIEVAPLVRFRKAPHTPNYVAGLFNYRGTIVPVIDLTALIAKKPSKPLLSTRIILVKYVFSKDSEHILGLMAEKVMETITCSEDDFQPPGIDSDTSHYLGDVMYDTDGMIQKISFEKLFPDSLKKLLFKDKKEA
ncbi:MAG: purine-binding chemotaxis protein CheW [Candidatus Latescibacteria bacterium]|nr:purine-binding chemotaxis protein CheW [Candidatus Latescibacterota bacterium]